jgi:uncharacterized protein (TIGR02001 family)
VQEIYKIPQLHEFYVKSRLARRMQCYAAKVLGPNDSCFFKIHTRREQMSKMTKTLVAAAVLAASTLVSGTAMAGASANIGMVSDYIFRGIDQGSGATASAGLDYDMNGIYVGTWAADVTTGMEYDLYAGYAGEYKGFSYDIGYVTYNYTNDAFDSTYQEGALTVGYGPISASYVVGTHDARPDATPATVKQDYTFASVTAEYKSVYVTFGSWGNDAKGSYVEAGYNTAIGDWDATVSLINSDKDLAGTTDVKGAAVSDMSIVLSVSKSIDL